MKTTPMNTQTPEATEATQLLPGFEALLTQIQDNTRRLYALTDKLRRALEACTTTEATQP